MTVPTSTLTPSRILAIVLAIVILGGQGPLPAEEGSSSATYIIGPGDIFNFRLHGLEGSAREGVRVESDGTLSYADARRVRVEGLTIPAAKTKIEEALAESIRFPKIVMNPVALGSKKYTILGMVRANGTYPIAKNVTLLDAIAESGGIIDGAVDFHRSFLSRSGSKLPVDFKKLYSGGDLSQNETLRNGDYVYIASVAKHECYVFGAVGGSPQRRNGGIFGGGELVIGADDRPSGVVPMGSKMTVIGAIAAAGGYAPQAWKNKVLVVRGSLATPELIVVNTADILSGSGLDILLEPGDIVYVHTKPWAVATQLVDIALRSFITAAISNGVDVGTSVGL